MLKRNDPKIVAAIAAAKKGSYTEVKDLVKERIVDQLARQENNEAHLKGAIDSILSSLEVGWSNAEKRHITEEILNEITGYGPLQPLIDDAEITEIMVNRYDQVYIERNGILEPVSIQFRNDRHVLQVIEKIIEPLGRRLDESSPMVDARMVDGSRINAARSPVTIDGTCLTIRKFGRRLTIDDLIKRGALTDEVANFLSACVKGKLNIIITGGTGSGKTTMLNCLSSYIPTTERIITIEDAAELQLQQPHVVRLETRPPNIEGKGAISIRHLVINSLRMRPDRIVVGECRGGEALDMLQAMNTGHEGSLTTAHANSPIDALNRLENLVLMAGQELPHEVVRELIGRAIELIVHTDRLVDGRRRVTHVTEVRSLSTGRIETADIYRFEQTGIKNGVVEGGLMPTGERPRFIEKLKRRGIILPGFPEEGYHDKTR